MDTKNKPITTIIVTDEPVAAQPATLTKFLREHYFASQGHMVLFGDAYKRFMRWLPPDARPFWGRVRFSQHLPPEHPTGVYTANKTYITNLSADPVAPTKPLTIARGRIYKT